MLPSDLKENPQNYRCIHKADKSGSTLPKIRLVKTIKFNMKEGRGVAVFIGMMGKEGKKVVVKWHVGRKDHDGRSSDIREEENFYFWLHSVGCETAEVYLGYHLVLSSGKSVRVLAMEYLKPLENGREDPFRVGLDILDQLGYIHKKCAHSGIKPDNILRIPDDDRKYKYLLIDFGSVSSTKYKDGYLRRSWPVGWSVQDRKESDQITYPYHDYVELGITLRHLSRDNEERKIFKAFTDMAAEGASRKALVKYLRDLDQ